MNKQESLIRINLAEIHRRRMKARYDPVTELFYQKQFPRHYERYKHEWADMKKLYKLCVEGRIFELPDGYRFDKRSKELFNIKEFTKITHQ